MVMADSEDVLKFTNRFHDATKRFLALGFELEDEKIVGNFCIAMKGRYPELCHRFDVQNNITFDEMKNLAASIESTETESKAQVDESGAVMTASVNGSHDSTKPISCFGCGKPHHGAIDCTNPRKVCYNCGKLGSHTAKECTALPINFPQSAHFPSGRVEKQRDREPYCGCLFHSFRGNNRRNTRGSFGGRNCGNSSQPHRENNYRKVKFTSADGRDRFVMLSETDDTCFELPESSYANGELITFIGDSGATEHIVKNDSFLNNINKFDSGEIKCANKNQSANLKIKGSGCLNTIRENNKNIKLNNVLVAPDISRNIVSLRKVVNTGVTVGLSTEGIKLIDKNENIIIEGPFDGKFWYLQFEKDENLSCLNDSNNSLHSMNLKQKNNFLGQGVTNSFVFLNKLKDNKNDSLVSNEKVSNEGSKNSQDLFHDNKVCDESLNAEVEEEHNYAKRSLDQQNENNKNNEIQNNDEIENNEEIQNNENNNNFNITDLDPILATNSFEEMGQMRNKDTSASKNKIT
ncbi:hypothetical protein V9T40_001082 [Parthenolecanium corni]|uniref:CCHC-type domain-containing protein n=1 Tax=Parthenolecanium corni TaxID=536013 RepID=A0AAN9Y2C4_9HEMI